MEKEVISTESAPAAVGPYSQAVRVGQFIYTAGQIAIDPQEGQLIEGDVAAQTEQVMRNLSAVLAAASAGLGDIIKTTIFLRYMKDFAQVNEVYGSHFGEDKPARSTVAVAALPLGALVEIEVVALAPSTDQSEPEPVEKPAVKQDKKKKKKKKKK